MKFLHESLWLLLATRTLVMIATLGLSVPASADQQINLSREVNDDKLTLTRIAMRGEITRGWLSKLNTQDPAAAWRLNTHLELSLGHWEAYSAGPNLNDRPSNLQTLSIIPFLRYARKAYDNGISPFVELGIGAVLLSEDNIQDDSNSGIDLGARLLFEDKLSVGLRFGPQRRLEAALSASHYSNARLASPNDGADFYGLTLGYWF